MPRKLKAPAVVNTAVTNSFGLKVQVIVVVGSTGTTISKNGVSISGTTPTSVIVTVDLLPGETITLSQTTGVTWTWWLANVTQLGGQL